MSLQDSHLAKPTIFFDGVCNLCNGFVDWLIQRDRNQIFLLASLQGQKSHELFGDLPKKEDQWSVLYIDEHGVYQRSTAVLKIVTRLGGVWSLCGVFWIFPLFFREWIYRWIARHRYQWFGKRSTCRVASAQERKRFLD